MVGGLWVEGLVVFVDEGVVVVEEVFEEGEVIVNEVVLLELYHEVVDVGYYFLEDLEEEGEVVVEIGLLLVFVEGRGGVIHYMLLGNYYGIGIKLYSNTYSTNGNLDSTGAGR